ncbi:Rne/Rng family ribonuclease [Christensenellaceae bacterium OttesenSCG-928-K19]|nr:Rne/Rng family ribonuclease [Christensenellaceae bacterium OttesenSCG-928-K19]
MVKKIIADVNPHEARVALIEEGSLVEVQVEMRGKERLVGNIYKGRVANILPGMQAAFVDVGLEKNAFLYAGDILCDEQDFEFDAAAEGEQIKRKLDVPNIKDILQQNQEIVVQVLKQPGGNKGARVTTHVTLPGRLLVLMPTVDHIGVSRRIENEEERERLKELAVRIKPEGMGLILRTAAEHASEEEIAAEVNFYSRLWDRVCGKADFLTAPRLIHAEENLLFRTARDLFTEDVEEFIINDKDYFEKITALVNIISPTMVDRLTLYEDEGNIFDNFAIEDKIEKALSRKVWLKNGCYLVIDETEALTVIDVNTGKYIGEDNLQDTILNANIEAAEEIARQLRLRDISGIIVIDFIDMEVDENKQLVVQKLEEALHRDRTKSNVLGMTELGLVEMTRKKMRRKLSALTQTTCPTCGGSGFIYNLDNMAMRVRREVGRTVKEGGNAKYLVEVSPALEEYIVNKNNQNQAVLPPYETVQFYIKGIKGMHPEQIKVLPIIEKDVPNGAQVFC